MIVDGVEYADYVWEDEAETWVHRPGEGLPIHKGEACPECGSTDTHTCHAEEFCWHCDNPACGHLWEGEIL